MQHLRCNTSVACNTFDVLPQIRHTSFLQHSKNKISSQRFILNPDQSFMNPAKTKRKNLLISILSCSVYSPGRPRHLYRRTPPSQRQKKIHSPALCKTSNDLLEIYFAPRQSDLSIKSSAFYDIQTALFPCKQSFSEIGIISAR